MKKDDTRIIADVPTESTSRKPPVSSWKATADIVEKKKALSPKAASGKAVAEPRCLGKFDAAVY